MSPRKDDDDEVVGRKNRSSDDDDGGEEVAITGFGPKALYLRLQKAIQLNRKRFVMIAGALFASGFFMFVIWSILVINEMRRPTIEMAIDALDFGAHEQARQYASSVLKHAPKDEKEKIAAALYVYGVALCEEVDQMRGPDKQNFFREAADSLMESRELGFIPERSAEGYYYLGKSLYFSQNYPEAIENLTIALEKDASRQEAINWYLANAYFYAPEADNEKGLEALDRFESLPPILEHEKQAAILMRVLMNLRLKRLDVAKASFKTLSGTLDSTGVLYRELIAGMIAMQEGERFHLYADALEDMPQLSVPQEEIAKLKTQLQETPLEEEIPQLPEHDRHASPFLRQFYQEQTRVSDVEANDSKGTNGANTAEINGLHINAAEVNGDNPNGFAPESPPEPQIGSEPVLEPAERLPVFSSKDIAVQTWRRLATQRFNEAIKYFDNVRRKDSELLEFYRQAAFLKAMCFERLGEYERAQEEYLALIRTFPGTSEAIVSQFRWGYIEYLIKDNHELGLASLTRFFEMLEKKDSYTNRWMSLQDIIDIGVREIQHLIDTKQYSKAIDILEYFRTIVPKEQQARLFAHAYSLWGEQLEEQASRERLEEREKLEQKAREKFREAGHRYEELAQWTFATPTYLSNLWTSAEYHTRGRNLTKALEIYRLYLEHEIVQRQALAHYRIGEILFELNEVDAAIKELEYCIDSYPNDPVLEETRLVLAMALQEKKNWSRAASLLKQNLDGKYAPNSDVYMNSIFELGRVYDRTGNQNAVISVFEDVLQLYPDDPRMAESHYMIAKANQNLEPKLKTQMAEAPLQNQRDIARQTLEETQRQALSHLKQAREILLKTELENGLDTADQRMLRNTFFMPGRLLTAMGEQHYDEAVRESKSAIARYMSHPDVLQAYLQLARVYQLQGDTELAAKTMTQARSLFQRFQAAKAFQQDTVYTEQQWRELLGTQ